MPDRAAMELPAGTTCKRWNLLESALDIDNLSFDSDKDQNPPCVVVENPLTVQRGD